MSNRSSEEIRYDIDVTRQELSADVNALSEGVKPGNVARRQVGKVRGAVGGVRDRVMGAEADATHARHAASSRASDAAAGIQSAAHDVADAAAAAPDRIIDRTEGNPLAAGLIAFGVGWLTASLIPTTQREQQAAVKVKNSAEPLKEQVSAAAKETADSLREPARQAADSVKQTATDAVQTTKEEGTSAAHHVRDDAKDAAQTVQDSRG